MKLLCIDSNSIINRAFYGIKLLTNKDGVYTNAVYGFFSIFKKLCDETNPDAIVCAFDLPAPTFRHSMYDGYKAGRKRMPEELAAQLPIVKELLGYLGVAIVEREGYEADDVLGTFAKKCRLSGDSCVIATGDRDSLQLVSDATSVLLASTKMGKPTTTVCTPAYIKETYGITPEQLIDVKALMGDSSDNIPGVAGIGEKGALKLIGEYGTLDHLYEDLKSSLISEKLKEKLESARESAYLSRDLARICCDLPIEGNAADFVPKNADYGAARALLAKLQMFSLIERLSLPEGGEPSLMGERPAKNEERPVLPVRENDEQALKKQLATGEISLLADIRQDELWAFAVRGDTEILLYFGEKAPALFFTVMQESCQKRVNDAKRIHHLLLKNQKRAQNITFDVRLAGYLLSPNSSEYTVSRLLEEYGLERARPELPGESEYGALAGACANFTELCEKMAGEIEKNGLFKVLHEIELPLAEVLASMELVGFRVNAKGIQEFGSTIAVQITALENAIWEAAGDKFNINSTKQLGEVLFERLDLPTRRKNKSGYSTDAQVLESLQDYHPIIPSILEYRKLTKLKSTYVDGLLKVVSDDGRIRSVFQQTETRTGRISSTEPNMQNIPVRTELGSKLRAFFIADEGCTLVDADYSQIELRVLAHISADKNMREAFMSGEDIHTQTAGQVFGLPPLLVTPQMRSRAKAVNFGIVYGIGAFSLSKDIGVPIAEADRYIKSYLETYSGVKKYMEDTVEHAKSDGYVTTLFGRRRYLPELNSSNKNIQAFGRRVAMNTPIQGTAADIIKLAMIRVYERLQKENYRARLILQVHDELIVEAPENERDSVSLIVQQEMENAAALSVKLKVDLNTGASWYDAK